MPDPKDIIHEAEEKVEDLIHEAEEGQSARTPAIALTGVTLVILAAASVMIVALLIVYFAVK
jgi:hypothetical protein